MAVVTTMDTAEDHTTTDGLAIGRISLLPVCDTYQYLAKQVQAVRIYPREYILTAFVYKDIPRISMDTPLF